MQLSALALWCAVVAAACACAAAYTVDCNHEYTDCDNELSKLTSEDDDMQQSATTSDTTLAETTQTPPKRTSPKTSTVTTDRTTTEDTTDDSEPKPRSRLLNLSINDLQSFADALHNQTQDTKKTLSDLSDVTLDGDEDEPPKLKDLRGMEEKLMPNKFFSNLKQPIPFHPMSSAEKVSEEDSSSDCQDNGIMFKMGDKIDRGCEETCECMPTGNFECSPRCKHPYIRKGRKLNDPLCFESPVDDCCSIIACATGNGETKLPNGKEFCKYENETYPVGTKWSLGCEQICSCDGFSIVTCKPRCTKLPPSDKCINVQDPNDACCEVQVCDVSQDVHEVALDNSTSTTSSTTSTTTKPFHFPDDLEELAEELKGFKSTMRPLVLAEPIGSVKVLHNNTVQVNLMHMNNSQDPIHLLLSSDGGKTFEDVELKYSNLILNLEGGKDYVLKTKETGTKFNFTITAMGESRGKQEIPDAFSSTEELMTEATKIGCYQDGKFYAVGEEYHIGCSELCECTGQNSSECAALQCPNHVGLELVSRGCVQWATGPPPQPPNCCPRAARCLSDGTCHYKGHAVPNWSEAPIALTGCEERCFCENGELDCQEVCTPLPPLPPQTLRCPPLHRPAPVNISDEDCCKQWSCVPNAVSLNATSMPGQHNFTLTKVPMPATAKYVLPIPWTTTRPMNGKPKDNEKNLNEINDENKSIFAPTDIYYPYNILKPKPTFREEYDFTYNRAKPVNSVSKYAIPGKLTFKPAYPAVQVQDMYHMDDLNNNFKPPDQFYFQDPNKRRDINKPKEQWQKLFRPNLAILDIRSKLSELLKENDRLFQPNDNILAKYNVSVKVHPQIITSNQNSIGPILLPKSNKHVTFLKPKDIYTRTNNRESYNLLLTNDSKIHILTKDPNPYEAVIFRFPHHVTQAYVLRPKPKQSKTITQSNLEQLLEEMSKGSEVSRNTQRSTNKRLDIPLEAGATAPPPPLKPHTQQPFLPTIPPPEPYPPEDIDYEQNNIHKPIHPVTPPIKPILPSLPGLPPPPPNYGEENKKLTVISLQADSPISVKMLFGLPPVLVGLRGSVDLRYTDKADEDDISRWQSQVFAPADEILSTSRLEFRLAGLKPSTLYRIRGKLFLHNLPVEPVSDVYSVRTLDLPSVEEKRREIDSRLTVMDTNDTTAHVSWRHFSEEELLLIDGIQVRYRPVGTPIYIMTELLHHSRSNAELRELRPGSRYEASLVLVPPPRALTELFDPTSVEFTTAPYVDPYNWSVVLEARSVGSEAAELTWRGVPSPAERWVRVYRAAHACGDGRAREHDAFRLAARDQPPVITLTGLEPDTRCRVWLELFLTNGKVKTSNVLEVNTKSPDQPEPIDNAIEASSIGGRTGANRGDYYGALVVVGVIAALGAVTSLLLLLIVVRRHRPRSVPITPVPSAPRDSSLPPYESPAYKLELQQETMDL